MDIEIKMKQKYSDEQVKEDINLFSKIQITGFTCMGKQTIAIQTHHIRKQLEVLLRIGISP